MAQNPSFRRSPGQYLYWGSLVVALGVFLFAGILLLPLLGLQVDEVLFVYHLWFPERGADWVSLFHHALPTMMMTYLGGLKSWLYAPLFAIFGTSPWLIRLPALGLAALTIGLTGYLLCEIDGRAAGLIGVWLLATDITFLVTAVFDWGPVVLQNLLLVAGLLLVQQWGKHKHPILIFATGFLFGLALWDKALFFWNLSGMAIAVVVVKARDLVHELPGNVRRFAVHVGFMLLGLALGSAPLIRYNARPGGGTVTKNANLTTKEIVPKAEYLYSALNGVTTERNFDDSAYPQSERVPRPLQKLARALVSKSGWLYSSWRVPAMLVCIPLGLIFAPPLQRKWKFFF